MVEFLSEIFSFAAISYRFGGGERQAWAVTFYLKLRDGNLRTCQYGINQEIEIYGGV